MRVLVTGGAGFLGSHVIDSLTEAGHEPFVIDDLSTGHRERLPGSVSLAEVDVRDSAAVARALERFRPHTVVHLAARQFVGRVYSEDVAVNVLGALAVAEEAAAAGVEHVVLASSAAVYGELRGLRASEDHQKCPRSANGVAKLAVEGFLVNGSTSDMPPMTALRFANLYGPGASVGTASAMQSFIEKLTNGQSPEIDGDGLQTRDFVDVRDAARAVLAAVVSRPRGAFNVGTGVETSIRELASRVAAELGIASFSPILRAERPDDVRRSCLDPSGMFEATGFLATTDLSTGLAATVAWCRATILQD